MPTIDLTHTFAGIMPTYPGDPQSHLTQIADIEKFGYNDHQMTTGMHVGTHIDAPLHMLKNGKRISEMILDTFFGVGKLIDARRRLIIDADILDNVTLHAHDIAIMMTGWDGQWGTEKYFTDYPKMTEQFAKRLVEAKISMIGMDAPSPDKAPFEIHQLLLRNDILIIENLTNLASLIPYDYFDIIALPLKLYTDAAPARVVARTISL